MKEVSILLLSTFYPMDFRIVSSVWYVRIVPSVWYVRIVPSVWYVRIVTSVWYVRIVTSVWYVLFFIILPLTLLHTLFEIR